MIKSFARLWRDLPLVRLWRNRPIASRDTTLRLTRALLDARQTTDARDQKRADVPGDIRVERADWVPMLVDQGHTVMSDSADMCAQRAITADGELLWYVLRPGKPIGFHGRGDCAQAAFEEMRGSIAKRRTAREHRPAIKAFARDLRWGRARNRVTLEQAHASGLCVHGIDHFSRRFGLTGHLSVPGFVIGWLMLIEPQLSLILYQTMLEDQKLPTSDAAAQSHEGLTP